MNFEQTSWSLGPSKSQRNAEATARRDGCPSTLAAVDRSTFNYGAALGRPKHGAAIGPTATWEDQSPASRYDAMMAFCGRLAEAQQQLSRHQWALEMALRDIRCACSTTEQTDAIAAAEKVWYAADRGTEVLDGDGARWHRYGRVGNVLRRFNPFAR